MSSSLLPDNLKNMTLQDLLDSDDVEIHKKNNVLRISRVTPTNSLTIEIKKYPEKTSCTYTQIEKKNFNQMEDYIYYLRSEGITQKEVANILGTTQTNISKIERKMKKIDN